jgi:hypothetical protein
VLAGVPGTVGHVELDVVAVHRQQSCAGGGVIAGQVGYGHARQLPMEARHREERTVEGTTTSPRGLAVAGPTPPLNEEQSA